MEKFASVLVQSENLIKESGPPPVLEVWTLSGPDAGGPGPLHPHRGRAEAPVLQEFLGVSFGQEPEARLQLNNALA